MWSAGVQDRERVEGLDGCGTQKVVIKQGHSKVEMRFQRCKRRRVMLLVPWQDNRSCQFFWEYALVERSIVCYA